MPGTAPRREAEETVEREAEISTDAKVGASFARGRATRESTALRTEEGPGGTLDPGPGATAETDTGGAAETDTGREGTPGPEVAATRGATGEAGTGATASRAETGGAETGGLIARREEGLPPEATRAGPCPGHMTTRETDSTGKKEGPSRARGTEGRTSMRDREGDRPV